MRASGYFIGIGSGSTIIPAVKRIGNKNLSKFDKNDLFNISSRNRQKRQT